jgi:choice-of-anchor C domain-containing protein
MLKPILTLAAALGAAGQAHAAAFVNGGFETTTQHPGSWYTVAAGEAAITGWTVDFGSADITGAGLWTASEGAQSIDLAGLVPGQISQTFDTVAGATYTVTFDQSMNPYGNTIPSIDVLVDGVLVTTSAYTGTARPNAMDWRTNSITFVAAGGSTRLSFASRGGSPANAGAAIDNVRVDGAVAAVPEAASWAMMIAGFGLIGGTLRRRGDRPDRRAFLIAA